MSSSSLATIEDHVAVITLTEGSASVLTKARLGQLVKAVEDAKSNPTIAAAMLIGGGGQNGVFCPDLSLEEAYEAVDDRQLDSHPLYALVAAIESSPKPFIAVINGSTSDYGLAIALGCHFRVAVEGATRVSSSAVSLGLVPIGGVTLRLPRCVGLRAAFDVICLRKVCDWTWAKSTRFAAFTIPFEADVLACALGASKAVEKMVAGACVAKKSLPNTSTCGTHLEFSNLVNFTSDALLKRLLPSDPITAASSARPVEVPPSQQALALLTLAVSADPTPVSLLTGKGSNIPTRTYLFKEAAMFNKLLGGVFTQSLRHVHASLKHNAQLHAAAPSMVGQRFGSAAVAVLVDGLLDASLAKGFELCSQLMSESVIPEVVLVVVGGSSSATSAAAMARSKLVAPSSARFHVEDFPPRVDRPLGIIFSTAATMEKAVQMGGSTRAVVVEMAGASLPDPRAAAAVYGSVFAAKPTAPLGRLSVVEVCFTQPTHKQESLAAIRAIVGCSAPIVGLTPVGSAVGSTPADAPLSRILKFGEAAGVGPIAAQLLLRMFASAMAVAWEGALPRDVDVILRRFGFKMGPFALMDKIGLKPILDAFDGPGVAASKGDPNDMWAPLRTLVAEGPTSGWFASTPQPAKTLATNSADTTRLISDGIVPEQPPQYRWASERILIAASKGAGITRRAHLPVEVRQRIVFSLINEATLLLAAADSTPQIFTSTLFSSDFACEHPRQHFSVAATEDIDLLSVLGGACGGFPSHYGGLLYWASHVLRDGRGSGSAKAKAALKRITTTKRSTPQMIATAAANRELEGFALIANQLSVYNLALAASTTNSCPANELSVQRAAPLPVPTLQALAVAQQKK